MPLLIHMGADAACSIPEDAHKRYYGIHEVQAAGESRLEHFGVGMSGTMPAARSLRACPRKA